MMVWLIFILTAAVIVVAANQLAKYGDVIAVRTHMGGMFIGILLMAGATSLPELLTSISSLNQNTPNLAAGNLLGSNTYNMFLLAIIGLVGRKRRILRQAALKHALTGSLAVFMIALVVFFLLADIPLQIGWLGFDSLMVIAVYVVAVRLIQGDVHGGAAPGVLDEIPEVTPSLQKGFLGFLLSAALLVVITPVMVQSASQISEITGLGTTFIGTTLVALVTSLPEMVTTLAAVRIGADDMAIGNLFGSNMFNMFAVGLTDAFFLQGRFLEVIDASFLLVAVLGLLMTGMGLIGNLAKIERRLWVFEIDAVLMVLVYISGLWLLYLRS